MIQSPYESCISSGGHYAVETKKRWYCLGFSVRHHAINAIISIASRNVQWPCSFGVSERYFLYFTAF